MSAESIFKHSRGLIDPTSAPVTEAFPLPERPASLDGKALGILVHTKRHAPILFGFVEQKLRERYKIPE